jgi:hypothetical protein
MFVKYTRESFVSVRKSARTINPSSVICGRWPWCCYVLPLKRKLYAGISYVFTVSHAQGTQLRKSRDYAQDIILDIQTATHLCRKHIARSIAVVYKVYLVMIRLRSGSTDAVAAKDVQLR